ncbi:MAG: AMP-binding protein [Bacteroidales bacterium]
MIQLRNKNAIVYQGLAYTYKELLQYSSCYADCFSSEKRPDKVLIFADNSPEWFFAFYGAMKCNAIVIPVDAQSTPKELAYIINDCKPDIIFISINKIEILGKAVALVPSFSSTIVSKEDIDIQNINNVLPAEILDRAPDDTLIIIYTSGTTGSPKGVMLSHKNILFNIQAVSKDVSIFKEDSNVMVLLPLHHVFPLIGTVVAPMYTGATVYIAEGLNAENILKTLNEGKISLVIGVPRLYDSLAKGVMNKINSSVITKLMYKLVDVIGSDSLSKIIFKSVHKKFGGAIQYLVCGGAALSKDTAKVFKTLGFYVLEGFGMTETAPMITFTRPGKRKIGYAGHPLQGIEVKIAGNGEVLVKGDNIMQGYYQRPEETAQVIKNGWLHTGDVGILDKYGLKLTGRIKDIIVTSNGKNINPDELEVEILRQSKLMKEVGVFMKDAVLQAVIYPELTELRDQSIEKMHDLIKEDIAKFNTEVAPYKRIKRFHIVSEELPKTRLGKVQRFKLEAMIALHQQSKKEDENKERSKVYTMLKNFVESETGYQAGEHDHFEIDLSMDSLSRVALLAYIETSFGINLNEEQLESLHTLGTLTAHIEEKSQIISENEISWKEILSAKIQDIKLPQSGFIGWCTNHIFKAVLHLTYIYRGKGETNIPQEPCIIVANHRSALDGMIITSRLRQKISKNTFFFAKEKHWRSPFARFMAGKNNIILMDINRNLRESLQQMSAVLKKGKNVIIFPEGTRSKDNKLSQFKETFAILSREMNVPIVPVVIQGSEKATFKSIKIPRLFARIDVDFLQPIYPQAEQSAKSLRDKVVDLYNKRLKEKRLRSASKNSTSDTN